MACRLGLLALAWHSAAKGRTSVASLAGAFPAHLRSERGKFLRLEEKGLQTLEMPKSNSEDQDGHPDQPAEPLWIAYPSDLSRILETMVVTRYWGNAKWPLSTAVPVPALYEKFDCVRHVAFDKTSFPCKTLLCQADPSQIARCTSAIRDGTLNVAFGDFVAFFGEDLHLSEVASEVKDIGSHFRKTYFEGYDTLQDGIDVLPIGLQEYYLRFQDFHTMLALAQQSDTSLKGDAKVLGAHGKFWTIENPSRDSAAALCSAHENEEWLSCDEVPTQAWWATLSKFSFLLNPTGNGIQSPKFAEALLMGVVPICTREPAFVKLEQSGWPLLLVDSFNDVASMDLTQKYEEFRPRLASIRKTLFLDGYWSYLQTGHV